jgi:hypothetical protein
MTFGRALIVLVCTAVALPAYGRPGGGMTTTIPPELASSLEGCWDLAPQYRILLRRTGQGVEVQQRTVNRLGKRMMRTDKLRYDPRDQTLRFAGIGSIHRVVVILRVTDAGLESAFSSEISSGKWMTGTWEKAARCTATTLDDSQSAE